MSHFINREDFDASVHREILAALTREDEAVVEICEDRAIEEMRCYIGQKYDCDKIFSATAAERHPLVLMMAVDIAVYHIFCIHNPQKMSPMRKDRYDRAVEWLKAVRKGDLVVNGLPQAEETAQAQTAQYLFHSNPKHTNHI
ncbi:MAG: DUF1320 domain-containing protein [Alistipes sp.]